MTEDKIKVDTEFIFSDFNPLIKRGLCVENGVPSKHLVSFDELIYKTLYPIFKNKIMKKSMLLRTCVITFLMQLLFVSFSFGQDITVQGNVRDIFNRILFGTSVKLNGTTTEVFTDSMGHYEITVPTKGKLIFSHEGFVTQKIAVKGKKTIDVL